MGKDAFSTARSTKQADRTASYLKGSGYKTGGTPTALKPDSKASKLKPAFADGGVVEGEFPKARGDRFNRGGAAKPATTIDITVNSGKPGGEDDPAKKAALLAALQAASAPPPAPPPPAPPPAPAMGAPPGMPPGGGPLGPPGGPPMGLPPGMMPPPGMKSGGRAAADKKVTGNHVFAGDADKAPERGSGPFSGMKSGGRAKGGFKPFVKGGGKGDMVDDTCAPPRKAVGGVADMPGIGMGMGGDPGLGGPSLGGAGPAMPMPAIPVMPQSSGAPLMHKAGGTVKPSSIPVTGTEGGAGGAMGRLEKAKDAKRAR